MKEAVAYPPVVTGRALGCTLYLLCVACAGCYPTTPTGSSESKAPPFAEDTPVVQPVGNLNPAAAGTPVRREGQDEPVARNSRPLRIPVKVLPPLPTAADVVDVVLRIRPPYAEEPEITIAVTDPSRIAMFLGQLGRIDWKQKGIGLEQIRMIAPDIELTVYQKTGIHRDYAFYWGQDSFVDNVTNRLLEADVKHLRLLVVDELILQLAGVQAHPPASAEGAVRTSSRGSNP